MAIDVYEIADRYGVAYSGELVDSGYHDQVNYRNSMTLREVWLHGGKITRLRILRDPGYNAVSDISYIHATLPSGEIVPVTGYPHGCRFGEMKVMLVTWAKTQRVYAKAIGLLDTAVWSVLS